MVKVGLLYVFFLALCFKREGRGRGRGKVEGRGGGGGKVEGGGRGKVEGGGRGKVEGRGGGGGGFSHQLFKYPEFISFSFYCIDYEV